MQKFLKPILSNLKNNGFVVLKADDIKFLNKVKKDYYS